jgi:hypothetical protein
MDSLYRCVLRVASYESNAENAVFDLNPKPETRNANGARFSNFYSLPSTSLEIMIFSISLVPS